MFNEFLLLLLCYVRQNSKQAMQLSALCIDSSAHKATGGTCNLNLEIRMGFLEEVIPKPRPER